MLRGGITAGTRLSHAVYGRSHCAVGIVECFSDFRAFTGVAAAPVAPKRVGTHNGSFHCDEALSCFMIRLTNNFFNAEIIRSRDPQACVLFSSTVICIFVLIDFEGNFYRFWKNWTRYWMLVEYMTRAETAMIIIKMDLMRLLVTDSPLN